MGFTDANVAAGSTHTYRLEVVDPFGNKVTSAASAPVTISSTQLSAYASHVIDDGATSYWRLGEQSGRTGVDLVGFSNLTEGQGVGQGAAGAVIGDSDTAATFDGTSNGTAGTTTATTRPRRVQRRGVGEDHQASRGGKIVGFGSTSSGSSTSYDRHVYMDNAGHIIFGVYNNGTLHGDDQRDLRRRRLAPHRRDARARRA